MPTENCDMRAIFLFAHPDDEFGCYEIIRREVGRGNRVECYYMTDGGFGGQSVKVRQDESLHVLAMLGVSRERVHFFGRQYQIPDGLLAEHLQRATSLLACGLADNEPISSIYVSAWEGGHQDHDMVCVLGCVLGAQLKISDGVWQFSLYNGKGLRGSLFRVLKPLCDNGSTRAYAVPIKYRFLYIWLCLSYPSQWRTWMGLFPFAASKLLFGGRYYLQPATLSRVIDRPHTGRLLYERRGMARYDEIIALVTHFLNDLGEGHVFETHFHHHGKANRDNG